MNFSRILNFRVRITLWKCVIKLFTLSVNCNSLYTLTWMNSQWCSRGKYYFVPWISHTVANTSAITCIRINKIYSKTYIPIDTNNAKVNVSIPRDTRTDQMCAFNDMLMLVNMLMLLFYIWNRILWMLVYINWCLYLYKTTLKLANIKNIYSIFFYIINLTLYFGSNPITLIQYTYLTQLVIVCLFQKLSSPIPHSHSKTHRFKNLKRKFFN